MENDLILELDNVGPISHAKINIGKINIIGGKNSTGKSTASKILYCFLRANAPSGEKIIFNNISFLMKNIIRKLKSFSYKRQHIIEDAPIFRYEYVENDIITKEESEELDNIEERISDHIFENEFNFNIEDIIYFADFLNDIFSRISYDYTEKNRRFKSLKMDMDSMNDTINNILYDHAKLFESIFKQLIGSEFNIKGKSDFGGKAKLDCFDLDVADFVDFKNYVFSHENSFPIEQIYYLDSFSIYDRFRNGLFNTEHVTSLRDDLVEESSFKAGIHDNLQEKIERIENGINNLINGEVIYSSGSFEYKSNDGVSAPMKTTASGIKQIGVIQRLLSNYRLNPGSFIFIDEPEVNLHPEWQVKFAGILMLLAKHLDISLYINTHSPIFIEAINTYGEYHDLLDETNYYITEESEEKGKFSMNKIGNDELYMLYNDLGSPYDLINEVRVRTSYKDIE